MRKVWLALLAVLAISIGVAWGEGKNDKTTTCPTSSDCCCCSKSCPK